MSSQEFSKEADIKITITIHEALANFVYRGQKQYLKEYLVFIDEVDRFSEMHHLGFKGSKEVMSVVKYFYGTSADPLTEDDKGPNGLDCPDDTEYIKITIEENRKPT